MLQPRILTFNFHEPYLCLMAKTGLKIDVGYYERGLMARAWHTLYRDVPPNLTLLPEAEWRARLFRGDYHVVIAQNENNALDIMRASGQKLLIQHNRRDYLESTITLPTAEERRQSFENLLITLNQAYDCVFISESKRANSGLPGRVILPGIDLDDFDGYTGEDATILRVGNSMKPRNVMFDVDFQERACAGLPNRVVGLNPDLPNSAPSKSQAELLDFYRTHRCLLHVTREEFEDGYNLAMLEAMATGMPVVSLANKTSPLTDGVDGFVSHEADVLREKLQLLLNDRDLAREMGKRARETVGEKFPISKFAEAWREAIFEVAETTTFALGQHPDRIANAPKILVHFVSQPTTTARYMVHALAKEAAVTTAGFRVTVPVLHLWGFEGTPPHYSAQQIQLPHKASYRQLREALPKEYVPDWYLYIDSGPRRVERDLGELPWPTAAYLIDSHISPDLRLAMAAQFDVVFLAQKGQVAPFRKAGIPRLHWLPLACDPALHDVGAPARTLDFSYVGSLNVEEQDRRRVLLERIAARFTNSYVGRAWPNDMANIYARSKIVVNIAVNRDVNMRVFEAMASGALLMTDEADGLEDLFEDGKHLVIFRKDEDVFDCIAKYLADDTARERIATAGQALVLSQHTYAHRVRAMLDILRATRPEIAAASPEFPEDKPKNYYQNPREEVLARVPLFARRILDVGCGAGVLGRALKERRGAEFVAGVEYVEVVGREARKVLDHVVIGNLEDLELPFEQGFFDCIVCADVLEHLAEPEIALRKLAHVLAPDGLIVISIPNVQFSEVVAMLASGQWNYYDAGITDATHLRFFTHASVEKLVRDAGLEACLVGPLSYQQEDVLPRSPEGTVTMQGLQIENVTDREYEDLRTYQFVALAGHPGVDRLSRARRALDQGQAEAAAALALEAVGVDECERRRLCAKAFIRLGRLDEAEAQYKEAVARGDSVAAEEYGILLVGMSRPAEAEPLLLRALAELAAHDRAEGALGLLRMGQGNYANAYAHLKAAMQASFTHEGLVKHFMVCAELLNRLDEAEPLLRAFAEFYPGNAEMLCDHAAALIALERHDDARERLELGAMLHPDHARIGELLNNLAGDAK